MSVCVFRELTKTIRVRCLFSLDPSFFLCERETRAQKKTSRPSTSTSSAHVSSSSSNPSASFRARFAACASSASSHSAVGERGGEREEGGRVSGASRRNVRTRERFRRDANASRCVFFFERVFRGRGDARCFFPLRDVQTPLERSSSSEAAAIGPDASSVVISRSYLLVCWSAKTSSRVATRGSKTSWRVATPTGTLRSSTTGRRCTLCCSITPAASAMCARGARRWAARSSPRPPCTRSCSSPRAGARRRGTARQPPGRCRRTRRAGRGVVPADVRTTGSSSSKPGVSVCAGEDMTS